MSKIGDYILAQEEAQTAEQVLKIAQDKLNNMRNEASSTPNPEQSQLTVGERFRRFVNRTGLAGTINNKNYLKAEAWQYLAHLFHVHPVVECTAMVDFNEKDPTKNFLGVKCNCALVDKDGKTVGSGSMTALCSEKFLADKDEFAVYGMAQTRAISRAIRNTYGWVACDAGFEATPWDEMPKA